jgi:hypothetical protein
MMATIIHSAILAGLMTKEMFWVPEDDQLYPRGYDPATATRKNLGDRGNSEESCADAVRSDDNNELTASHHFIPALFLMTDDGDDASDNDDSDGFHFRRADNDALEERHKRALRATDQQAWPRRSPEADAAR